jgi:hypothetical protein
MGGTRILISLKLARGPGAVVDAARRFQRLRISQRKYQDLGVETTSPVIADVVASKVFESWYLHG